VLCETKEASMSRKFDFLTVKVCFDSLIDTPFFDQKKLDKNIDSFCRSYGINPDEDTEKYDELIEMIEILKDEFKKESEVYE